MRNPALLALLLGLFLPVFSFAATVNVSVGDDSFSPKALSVSTGDTVVWTNAGSMNHTVTADDLSFLSPPLAPGQTYSHTFNGAGTFAYYCQYHGGSGGQGMSGTVSASTAQTAPASTTQPSASVAQLQAQVQVLQQVLAQMMQQRSLGAGSTGSASAGPSSCSAIASPLGPGSSGAAVSQLQAFLARDPSVYSEAKVTGYFGPLTQAAVQRFQAKNGIVSSGDPSSTGYGLVGPRTASAIQVQCGTASGAASAQPGASVMTATQFGGFIQVSPVSGAAPLYVSVQASVNTTDDCGSSAYTLDFGDGTAAQQIAVAAGTCKTLQQTYTHTYPNKGTYQITLSAGAHESSATVVAQ